jgi:hypothetical protein
MNDGVGMNTPPRGAGNDVGMDDGGEKRGRSYLLLSEHRIIAEGTEHMDREYVHGTRSKTDTQCVIAVSNVHDPTFVPRYANPMEEPIDVGQFVFWKRSEIVEVEEFGPQHKKHRCDARQNYLKAARRQETRYQKSLSEVIQSFEEGETWYKDPPR